MADQTVKLTCEDMGRVGGFERARKLTPQQRRDIAQRAARARWLKKDGGGNGGGGRGRPLIEPIDTIDPEATFVLRDRAGIMSNSAGPDPANHVPKPKQPAKKSSKSAVTKSEQSEAFAHAA